MHSFDFEAVTYDGAVYCVGCLPKGVSVDDEDVMPIFADSEWDHKPVCDHCHEAHDYMNVRWPYDKVPDPMRHSALLRHVEIKGTECRLYTWDAGYIGSGAFTKDRCGYVLYTTGDEVLFTGDDYGCSPMCATDSDDALIGLLGFLTLKPGDTDDDYFDKYTPRQLEWCQGNECEEVSLIVSDFENGDGDIGRGPFRSV
jgi:hypothetical protein